MIAECSIWVNCNFNSPIRIVCVWVCVCVCVCVQLTETTVPIMHHEVSSQSTGSEVIHAAGPVCHIAHHQSVRLCESDKQQNQPINDLDHNPIANKFDGSTQLTDQSLSSGNVTQTSMSPVKWVPASCKLMHSVQSGKTSKITFRDDRALDND